MQIEIEDKVFKLRNLGFSIKPFLKRFAGTQIEIEDRYSNSEI